VPAPSPTSAWLASALDEAVLSLVDGGMYDEGDDEETGDLDPDLALGSSTADELALAAWQSLAIDGEAWANLRV
jgi:hypothetical protein